MAWEGRAVVLGPPATKGSVYAIVPKSGKPVVKNDNRRGKSWQQELAWAMRDCAPPTPLREPVILTATVYLARPACHFGTGKNRYALRASAPKFPVVKPDADKVLRVIGDAATGTWVHDDCYLVDVRMVKRYADDGQGERVEVEARELTGDA